MNHRLDRCLSFIKRYPPGNNVYADTSSLIYLAKIDLLILAAKAYNIFLGPSVVKELNLDAPDRFPETTEISRLLENNMLKRGQLTRDSPIAEKPLALYGGEGEVIRLYMQYPQGFILSDDRRVVKYCTMNNLPFTSSIMIPCLCFFHHLVACDSARSMIQHIAGIGYFSQEILDLTLGLLTTITSVKDSHG